MKKSYFKLDLKQINYDNQNEELNHLFFTKLNDQIYIEKFSNEMLLFENGKLIYPNNLELSLEDLSPSNISEVLESFNIIQKSGLTKEYFEIINKVLNLNNKNESKKLKRY